MIEIDNDGYPTDEALEAIKKVEFKDAAQWLIDFGALKLPYSNTKILYRDDDIYGPCNIIWFATGGWSGNESIMDAVLSNFAFHHLYWRWQSGGLHQFRIPEKQLSVSYTPESEVK